MGMVATDTGSRARINNAGINGGRKRFTEITPEMVETVVRIGLTSCFLALACCPVSDGHMQTAEV